MCGYLQLETLINIYSASLVLGIFFLIAVQMQKKNEKYISFIFARTDVWFCRISFRGSVYITFYRLKWNFISVKMTAVKQHSQLVSFRSILFKLLQEMDHTPSWKYFISPELKSHVSTFLVSLCGNSRQNKSIHGCSLKSI